MSDDLDPGEAANYIHAERPSLDEDDIWTVVSELDRPPAKDAEPLALQLISQTHPGISESDVRLILAEWRAFADLAAERDWDDDELDYVNRFDDD
jgi:hypothetical protein